MSLICLPLQAVGIAGAVEELVMVQHHVEHFRREAALLGQRLITAAWMLAHLSSISSTVSGPGLSSTADRNERLADVVQQRGAGEPALVVLAHAEMLRERDRKAGDEQAMAIAAGVMAADGRQPFPQRGMLDRLEDLVLGRDDVVEFQGNAGAASSRRS